VVCHRGDLHDVGIQAGEPLVQGCQVGRRLVEVVVADDPLRLPVPGHLGGDVVLEVDVFSSLDDRRAEHEQPLLLRTFPPASIHDTPAGDDHRAGTLLEKPLYLHVALDVIEP
jgi:hypothetical protein